MSGQEFAHSPSLHSLIPKPQLCLPLPLHTQPQPQSSLNPLHPSVTSSGGGRLQCETVKYLFSGGAVAHFDHKILGFVQGGGGSMDVRYGDLIG